MTLYRNAIRNIESRGSGGYAAVGAATRTGDRAYGAYGVMGDNIGPWTEEALGYRLTPEQFLKSPEAQDAVFDHKFGSYIDKFGSADHAASAWFTGQPISASSRGRADLHGTTGASYVSRFRQELGQPLGESGSVITAETRAKAQAIADTIRGNKKTAVPNINMLPATSLNVSVGSETASAAAPEDHYTPPVSFLSPKKPKKRTSPFLKTEKPDPDRKSTPRNGPRRPKATA